jgi:trigger factor
MEAVDSRLEDISSTSKKITISVEASQVDSALNSVKKKYCSKVKVNGFRPGKVPAHMVEKLYGPEMTWEATDKLVRESLDSVIDNQKLRVAVLPRLSVDKAIQPGTKFEFVAEVDVIPEVTLGSYKGLSIEIEKKSVTDEMLEDRIKQMRKSQANIKRIEDRQAWQKGDSMYVRVGIKAEGQEPVAATGYFITEDDRTGGGVLPEAVAEKAEKMTVGETATVEATVPDTSKFENLRGKKATFELTVTDLFTQELPQIDADFIKAMGSNAKDEAAFREEVKGALGHELQHAERDQVKTKCVEALVATHKFDLPQSVIDEEIRGLLVRLKMVSREQANKVDASKLRERFGAVAEKRVRARVLFEAIADVEKLDVEQADLQTYGPSVAYVENLTQADFKNPEIMRMVVNEVRNSKALDFVADAATVTTK